jgi:prefoldin subunit 5
MPSPETGETNEALDVEDPGPAPQRREMRTPPLEPPESAVSRPLPAWSPAATAPPPPPPEEDVRQRDAENAPPRRPWPPRQPHLDPGVPAPRFEAPAQPSRGGWRWVSGVVLGALLGGILGFGLSVLAFFLVNGALEVANARGVQGLNAQIAELSTELDALRTDTSDLQGSVTQLQQDVEPLAGLPVRVDRVEEATNTLTTDVEALQQENAALQASLDTIGEAFDDLATEVEDIQAQTTRTMSFFRGLRDLLTDTFGATP